MAELRHAFKAKFSIWQIIVDSLLDKGKKLVSSLICLLCCHFFVTICYVNIFIAPPISGKIEFF